MISLSQQTKFDSIHKNDDAEKDGEKVTVCMG